MLWAGLSACRRASARRGAVENKGQHSGWKASGRLKARPHVKLTIGMRRLLWLAGASGIPIQSRDRQGADHDMAETQTPVPSNPSWERVLLARHPKRPHALDYIQRLFTDFEELHGDRAFADDHAIVAGMGWFEERPVVIVGQQKGRDTKQKVLRNFGMPRPEGYRKAMRIMQMAAKFSRPIIALLDTPGAYPGRDAEERGQAEAIAQNLREMSRLGVPVIAVVIGEGGSGGALALGVGNRIYMLENAVYSVISPESCASIIYRDAAQAPKAAEALKMTAADALELGLIDGIVPEPGEGAHTDPDRTAEALRTVLREALEQLSGMTPDQLIHDRYSKFRRMGSFFSETNA
jgi:acetyl-CoA carboxylase carboxyl transferase subunit alpha